MSKMKITKSKKIALGVLTATMAVSPLASTAFAQVDSSPSKAQENTKAKHTVTLIPLDGGKVSPNAELQFQVNQSEKDFNSIRQQLENQSFGVLVTAENGEQVFLNAEDGVVSYNENGTITVASHEDFARYTGYTVTVLVKSDFQQAVKGVFPTELASATSAVTFQTGSSTGEATNVEGNIEDENIEVTETGTLIVEVTDDYGNPATNATLTVKAQGTGNAKVESTFVSEQTIQITNGTAEVRLADHSANQVALSYEVVDNVYADGDGEAEIGSTTVQFLPGDVAQVDLETPSKIQAGKDYTITGEAEDVYGNNVADDTALDVTATSGTVSNEIPTTDGQFAFDYKAPTKTGASRFAITRTTGDEIAYSINEGFVVEASSPTKATINVPTNLTEGQPATVSGTLTDTYGNPIVNEAIQLSGALTGTLTTNSDGAFSGSVNVSSTGAVTANIAGQVVPLTSPTGTAIGNLTVAPAGPVTGFLSSKSLITLTKVDGYRTSYYRNIFGKLTDEYGNPIVNARVNIFVTHYSMAYDALLSDDVYTDENGNFVLQYRNYVEWSSIYATSYHYSKVKSSKLYSNGYGSYRTY